MEKRAKFVRLLARYHSMIEIDMAGLIDIRGLTIELPTPGGWVRPVNGVSLSIAAGETLGIVGESGSGKTMLALALMRLLPAGARLKGEASLSGRGGSVTANGAGATDLVAASNAQMRSIRGREIAMIFQEPMTALDPVMRIGDQIEEAIRTHEPHTGQPEVRWRAIESLRRAAVPEPERRAAQFPHQLSGGLRQRAMIAMALAAGPRLLIADEPTTALDVTVQKQILDLLAELRRDLGLGLMFITHDLGVVAEIADRIAVMYAGRVVEEGPAAEVLRRPRHPYTEGLLRAAPRLDQGKVAPIPGMVPPLDHLPPGCSFSPRCAYHREECDDVVPDLRNASEGHLARCVLVG